MPNYHENNTKMPQINDHKDGFMQNIIYLLLLFGLKYDPYVFV